MKSQQENQLYVTLNAYVFHVIVLVPNQNPECIIRVVEIGTNQIRMMSNSGRYYNNIEICPIPLNFQDWNENLEKNDHINNLQGIYLGFRKILSTAVYCFEVSSLVSNPQNLVYFRMKFNAILEIILTVK